MAVDGGVADGRRWAAHPVLGGVLRVVIVVVPVLVGLAAGIALAHLLPAAQTLPGRIGWYAAVLGGSFGALLLTDALEGDEAPVATGDMRQAIGELVTCSRCVGTASPASR